MTPLLIGAAGFVALVAGGLVLRTFGAAYRIGRLLATAPKVTVAEANEIAAAGRRAYVRVAGRIDAADEFEDADHRPLVYRRVRLEARDGRQWRPFEDGRQVVPFTINEGLDAIAVDGDALGEGLIVVPRESLGRAADLADRVPPGSDPDTPIRVRIDQLSSIEHAIVVGYPQAIAITDPAADDLGSAGPSASPGVRARLTSGRGRPLILTILEPDEAMRILAGGDRQRTRLAAGLLGVGAILLGGALVWAAVTALLPAAVTLVPAVSGWVSSALAASPSPTMLMAGGDPRSSGQGPGLIGTPGLAILGVIAIAVLTVVVTSVYVRLTPPADRRPRPDDTGDGSRPRDDGGH
ncbi:MAG: hypothetical protein NVS9B8_03550 [Candidatus Limnocylindrales bacterium]